MRPLSCLFVLGTVTWLAGCADTLPTESSSPLASKISADTAEGGVTDTLPSAAEAAEDEAAEDEVVKDEVVADVADEPADAANEPAAAAAPSAPVGPPVPIGRVAELPRVYLDTDLPRVTGRTLLVPAGASLQQAIDSAALGDEIVLTAGATYAGTFRLRRKSAGAGWITIRSSAAARLPAPGERVTPADSVHMPRLVPRRSAERVIVTETAAHHYRLVGLEVTTVQAATRVTGGTLIELGSGDRSEQSTREAQPHSITLDRMYVHGRPTLSMQRCVALHSASTAIIDSWISECHGAGFDSQAIGGWNGTGPYKIVNNHLSGAGENVMFGGADPKIPGALPEDIEIRRNHFYKPAAWKNSSWTVKNLFELKIGRRILLEGNVFENNWGGAQTGYAWVLKSTNQSGSAPWSQTADVTARYNIIRNSAHGISIVAAPESKPAVPAARFHLEHNVIERVGSTGDHAGGRLFFLSGVDDVTLAHNTGQATHSAVILSGGGLLDRLVIRGNLFTATSYGISGNGEGYGLAALANRAAPGWVFEGNVVPGVNSRTHTMSGNSYPTRASTESMGPAALAGQFPSAGADLDAVRRATAGVVVSAP